MRLEPERTLQSIAAARPKAFAAAVVAFVVGFSLDDLRVLRFPSYLAGAAFAILLLAVGPLVFGRFFALRHRGDDAQQFALRAARSGRTGRVVRAASLVLLVGWLVFFTAGVPPWAN